MVELPFSVVLSRLMRLSLLVLTTLVFSSWLFVTSASAQSAGISIKPATIDETLDPGFDKDYALTITNLNATEQTFYLFKRNITGQSDGGAPIFAESNGERTGYELTDWISLSQTEVVIPGGESVGLNFTISIPEDASPGSHFGGIFVSVDPPEIESSGAAVGYQVANIISIRVSGVAIEGANVRQFSTGKYVYSSQNVDFLVRIENKGNVLVKPIGPLEIYNMFGKQVGSVIFNEKLSSVFPYDTREFTDLKWEGDSVGFGRYEAILTPSYGDTGARKSMSSTATFWILPMNIIGPAVGGLAFVLLLVFIFVRLYIKRSLEHLNHGRRMVRRRKRGGSSTSLLLLVVMLTVTALFLIVLLALFA